MIAPTSVLDPGYLATTVASLWPTSRVSLSRREQAGSTAASWFVLPSVNRPRLLIPTQQTKAAIMLRRYDSRRLDGYARRSLEAAVASGVLSHVPIQRLLVDGDDGIIGYLQRLFGHDVAVGVLLGSERANGKPVVQVFSANGETLAFVKVGHNVATGALVRGEAQALRALADAELRLLKVPQILHQERWNGLELLVLSPLRASQQRSNDDDPAYDAMLELAAIGGQRWSAVADVAGRLRDRALVLQPSEARDQVLAVLAKTSSDRGDIPVLLGAWHGDWAPWNFGRRNGRVEVWDWERFETLVPVGFDALHHRAQLLWRDKVPASSCVSHLHKVERALLEQAPTQTVSEKPSTSLYLAAIAIRYLGDQKDTRALRPRTGWVLDQLSRSVESTVEGRR